MSHVVGIVCEYNPFHNGHKAQIQYAREVLGADYVIAAMSPDFTQRGQIAFFDKYCRTEAALEYVDMVLEIPVMYSTASAEGYATAAIKVLAETGIVDTILFSSENANPELFNQVSSIILNESDEYKSALQNGLSNGESFASARANAIKICIKQPNNQLDDFLSLPNNILGLEYVKAIKKYYPDLNYETMERLGQSYHSNVSDDYYASATAIREALENNDESAYIGVPSKLQDYYKKLIDDNLFLNFESVSQLLHLKIMENDSFVKYLDCNEDISNKINKNKNNYVNLPQFIDLLKTKDVAYTRLSRIMCHILLGITNDDVDYKNIRIPYNRVLGIAEDATALFTNMKKHSKILFFSSVKEIESALENDDCWDSTEHQKAAQRQYAISANSTNIYNILQTSVSANAALPEICHKFIIK
ncbi:MAG: nucleotidyltransferase family protein [Lachnospiraceae bacterium]|nr:nucleotidyltransferase family protein [Lachnospiraceae bacterium]